MNRLARLQAFLAETPKDPFLQYALALEYLKLQEDQQALQIFMNLTINSPKYVGTYYHLGKLQEKLEQLDEALITYQKGMVVAREMGDHHSLSELQSAYNMLNDDLNF